jgi:hypothetical protein
MEHIVKKSLEEIKQFMFNQNVLQKEFLTFSEAAAYLASQNPHYIN